MNETTLEENVVPLIMLQYFKYKANIIPLIFWNFIILLNFAQHAYNRKQSIFLELILQLQLSCEVRLQQIVLNERESSRVELLN